MRIGTRIFWMLLGIILLMALVGAHAVHRQRAAALYAAIKETEGVARVVSTLVTPDAQHFSAAAQAVVNRLHATQGADVTVTDVRQVILADAVPSEIGTVMDHDPGDEVGATIRDREVRTFTEVSEAYPAGIKQIVAPLIADSGEVVGAIILEYTPLYNGVMEVAGTTIRQVALVGLAGVVLAALIALFLGRSIARPLRQLTNVAAALAAGRTDVAMPPARRDEIGELAAAFGDMVARRQRAEDELRSLRDALEDRVRERTEELETANAALQAADAIREHTAIVLRESEEKFRQMAENITDAFWIRSADLREVQYLSPGFERIWGRSPESLYAHPEQWPDFILPEDRERVRAAFAMLLEEATSLDLEYRIARPDGEQRWVRVRGFQVRDATGQLIRHTGIVSDITERKRAEAELAEFSQRTERRERLLNTALSSMQDFAQIYDRAGRLLYVNQPLLKLWGITLEAAVGRNFFDLGYPTELATKLQGQLQQVFATKQVLSDETPNLSSTGSKGWYEYIFSPVCGAGGTVDFVVGSTRDITERKQAEEASRESERGQREIATQLEVERARLVAAQAVAKVGSWETDLRTFAVTWSAETYRIFEVSGDSFLGTHAEFLTFVHPEDRAPVNAAFCDCVGQTGPFSIQHRLLLPEGRIKYVEERWQLFYDEEGVATRAVGTCQDVTERQRSEQAIERTLQRLNDAQALGQIGDWEWDLATEEVTWSPQVFALVGRDPRLGPPRSYEEQAAIYDAPSQAVMQENITRAVESGEAQNYELVMRRPDGEQVHFQAMAVPRKDQAGRVLGLRGTIQDISVRTRSENALRVSEERLRAALSASCTGTFRWDIRLNELSWDDSLEALFGLPHGGAIRSLEAFIAAVHPDDRPGVIERCERCAREGADFAMEFRVVWPDGSLHWLDDRGKTFSDAAGQPLYMTGACVDITERKRFENALRASEQRYHSLFDNMLEGYAYCRTHFEGDELRDFTYLEVNGAFAKLTGLENVAGKKVSEVLPGVQESNPELFQVYSRVARSGQPEKLEVYLAAMDLWLSITVYSCERESFVAVFDNITERKQAARLLLESQQRLALATEAAGIGIWDWDVVTNQLVWDAQMYALYGIREEDFSGAYDAWQRGLHPDDRVRSEAAITAAVHGADGFHTEFRVLWPNGEVRHLEAHALVRGANDAHMVGVNWDITARKRAERKIAEATREIEQLNADLEKRVAQRTEALSAATAEAERANQAKSEFLSRMSHELRTPMNAILGFAQVLETEEGLTDDHRESVSQILKGGGHLLKLINEVLDITGIESGRLTLSSEPIALAGLLSETLSLLRPLAAELQVQLVVLASESAGDHVQADRQRLKQVLLNLLGNALKYNRRGGSVTVRFGAAGGSPAVTRLSVTDTGAGLSAAKLARLFNPFDRLGAEQTHTEGTGLGLVLARRMVEQMGGTIGVESVVGQGSTFWIELPTAEAPLMPEETAAELAPAGEPAAPADGRLILYIEDNPSNVRLVTRILARRPAVRLLSAGTGTAGLLMARQHHPDLILLDLHLPDGHGHDVLTSLAADPRTGAIPVVMLTADAVAGTREALLASGARGFITKPLDVRAFLAAIDRCLAPG